MSEPNFAPVDEPLVSIGLPVYNGEPYIEQALAALLAQDYANFELLISDNASTDSSGHICRKYSDLDKRIRYFRADTPASMWDNFNKVLRLASGEYFMWAAHDDAWEPAYVSSLVRALQQDAGAVLAFSGYDTMDEAGRRVHTYKRRWSRIWRGSRLRQFAALTLLDDERTQKANHIYGLMCRETLLALGGLTEHEINFSGEDVVALIRLLARGSFVNVDRVLFHYRVRRAPGRGKRSMLDYSLERIAGRNKAHRGNLISVLLRIHVYHAQMRSAVLREAPLPLYQRLLLCAALCVREVWQPITILPAKAIAELANLRPGLSQGRLTGESGRRERG